MLAVLINGTQVYLFKGLRVIGSFQDPYGTTVLRHRVTQRKRIYIFDHVLETQSSLLIGEQKGNLFGQATSTWNPFTRTRHGAVAGACGV